MIGGERRTGPRENGGLGHFASTSNDKGHMDERRGNEHICIGALHEETASNDLMGYPTGRTCILSFRHNRKHQRNDEIRDGCGQRRASSSSSTGPRLALLALGRVFTRSLMHSTSTRTKQRTRRICFFPFGSSMVRGVQGDGQTFMKDLGFFSLYFLFKRESRYSRVGFCLVGPRDLFIFFSLFFLSLVFHSTWIEATTSCSLRNAHPVGFVEAVFYFIT